MKTKKFFRLFSERALLLQSKKLTTFRVWLCALDIHLLIYATVGLLVDYFHAGEEYLSIRHPAEFVNGINVMVIFVPMIWAYYFWLPKTIISTVNEWEKEGIIFDGGITKKNLNARLEDYFFSKWVYVFAVIATVIAYLVLHWVIIPEQINVLPLVDFWYYLPVPEAIISFIYTLNCFLLVVLVLRTIIWVTVITKFLHQKDCLRKLFPMHPDRAGGLGKMGLITIRIAFASIVIALWATIYAIYPIFAGAQPQWLNIIIVYFLYLTIMPILMYLSLSAPHLAMTNYKASSLMTISHELFVIEEQCLQDLDSGNYEGLKEKIIKVDNLVKLEMTIDEGIPGWPISTTTLRGFSLIATSPLVVGLFTILIETYLQPLLSP